MDHERYMRRAIEVARRNPDAPFGAVIVDDSGQVLAQGLNEGERNPVWQGELAAIMGYAEAHPGADWSRMTLYTTAEPCPMCSTAILWAGIPRVVYGTSVETLNGLGSFRSWISPYRRSRAAPPWANPKQSGEC